MSWVLAILGFIVLIILHEFGHFAVAKAVGMRVERFSLFFPPIIARKKVGETEYAIGALPLGGYVKISGMNPSEDLPDEVRTRAYYSQPVWKRVAVILAGPGMNFLIAFILLVVFFWLIGPTGPGVDGTSKGFPAYGQLRTGDQIVSIDGRRGSVDQLTKIVTADRCPGGTRTNGCRAARPLTVLVNRDGKRLTFHLTPVYDAGHKEMRIGFVWGDTGPRQSESLGSAISTSANRFWYVTRVTASLPARIFNSRQRSQLHGIVGITVETHQTIVHSPADLVGILALISLSLAVVNLFPFLPLDGGHIFWALVELVRRRPVSYATMERSGVVGFVLVAMLFVIGLTNDYHTITHGGFGQ